MKRGLVAITIDSFEMKIPRKIFCGPTEASGLWKVRCDEEIANCEDAAL